MINYMDFPLSFREKDQLKHKKSVKTRPFFIKAAQKGKVQPSAIPFVLNSGNDVHLLEFSEADNKSKASRL
jgi:hypothetical protein